MGKFILPSGPGRVEPPPQPTPEDAAADDARVNDLKNQFIDAKQQGLYTAPQAFLRRQGSDAITAAEGAGQFLDTLRRQTLDQTANDPQRRRLAEMLDWHLADAQEQIHRHVAQQSDAWQQSVAARTVELATRQAALESADAEKVGFVALAAYDAGKARALKAGLPAEDAHESGRAAWSGAYKAAIEAQAGIDSLQAVKLFDLAKATLDPQTREALQPRIDSFSREAQADGLADKALAPGADRASILDDPAVPPEVRLLAESKIATRETSATATRQSRIDTLDGQLGRDTPRALARAAYVPGTYAAIASGYAAAGDPDKTATGRRLAENETLLTAFAGMTPADQARTLAKLEPGAVRDQAIAIKDATDRVLADDPLLWGVTTQRANVGELVPLDPQTLDRREQQARHVEALSGRPRLALTRKEMAELKTTLDTAPLAGKQTMLRNLANGLTGDAVARLAPALAGQGPLADGYALALSAYAKKTPGQNALADRIVDGLDRMKAAGEGGRPVADTGPDWRRAFDERAGIMLASLSEKSVAARRTATAALYTQSMALKGKDGATPDSDELDDAIRDVLGGPIGRGVAPNVEPPPGSPAYRATIAAVPSAKVERADAKLDGEVTDWVTRPGPDGHPRIERPPLEIWNQLSDDQQQAVDAILAQNKQGTDIATDPKILDEIRHGLASDDPQERMKWAGVPLYQYKPYLSDADFRALLAVQSQYSPYTGLPREGLGHPIGTLDDHAELAAAMTAARTLRIAFKGGRWIYERATANGDQSISIEELVAGSRPIPKKPLQYERSGGRAEMHNILNRIPRAAPSQIKQGPNGPYEFFTTPQGAKVIGRDYSSGNSRPTIEIQQLPNPPLKIRFPE